MSYLISKQESNYNISFKVEQNGYVSIYPCVLLKSNQTLKLINFLV